MAERTNGIGFGGRLLYLLAGLGIVLAIWRFANGIGSVSNLNQGYPWGFWIGFDVLAGIALAAGGFVVAGLVHIFGGEKYHPLVRPAILTAFLGYLVFIAALLVDLGRPWTIWHMIIFWQHESPMFEVGWCVMLYTTILLFEFLPVVFEKKNMIGALEKWRSVSPWIAWGLLVLFAIALTNSVKWVIAIAAVLMVFEILVRAGLFRRDPKVPTLLIMAGVIFSTLHQSSLGTLFTMVPHKMHVLWYTPMLPVLFFLSAVMAGMAMVIIESLWGAKHFKREPELDLLAGLGRGLSWVILIYIAVRVVDLAVRHAVADSMTVTTVAFAFWLEILIGLAIPVAMLMTEEAVKSRRGLFWAALFVVLGVVINRLNVAMTAIQAEFAPDYTPHWMEIAISAGVVAVGILAYRAIADKYPVFEEQPGLTEPSGAPRLRPAGGSQS
jgi:formate dehydrogenase iron-sulfur subunit